MARAPDHRTESMSPAETKLSGVTVVAKANVYFDGGVVSHTVMLPGDVRKTLGLIRPGSYHFKTGAAECMEIVAGSCRVRLDGQSAWSEHSTNATFEIPGNSGFDIEVAGGLCEYICTFL
jgi:uncharacterized protein YaiE (UPF0345 family)